MAGSNATVTDWAELDDDALFVLLLEHGVTFGRAELLVRYRDVPERIDAIAELLT